MIDPNDPDCKERKMPFLQNAVIGGKNITVFPVPVVVPTNVFNTSRENVIRLNLGRRLESMSLFQLNALLSELDVLLQIDTEWPICLYSCGEANHAIISAAEMVGSVRGVIEAAKTKVTTTVDKTPASVPPAPSPSGVEIVGAANLNRTLFWGGVIAVMILAANKLQGGTSSV